MEYAIFANGTYWGVWHAPSAEEAIRAAVAAVGTEGNVDGLVAYAVASNVAATQGGGE
jgi:hypothetical protein